MKPYKLKHVPTGLYYQPHKTGGSNLSKRGKIYQTGTHGLSTAFKAFKLNPQDNIFWVYVDKCNTVYKQTVNLLEYTECKWTYNQVKSPTLVTDWIIEEIV